MVRWRAGGDSSEIGKSRDKDERDRLEETQMQWELLA